MYEDVDFQRRVHEASVLNDRECSILIFGPIVFSVLTFANTFTASTAATVLSATIIAVAMQANRKQSKLVSSLLVITSQLQIDSTCDRARWADRPAFLKQLRPIYWAYGLGLPASLLCRVLARWATPGWLQAVSLKCAWLEIAGDVIVLTLPIATSCVASYWILREQGANCGGLRRVEAWISKSHTPSTQTASIGRRHDNARKVSPARYRRLTTSVPVSCRHAPGTAPPLTGHQLPQSSVDEHFCRRANVYGWSNAV